MDQIKDQAKSATAFPKEYEAFDAAKTAVNRSREAVSPAAKDAVEQSQSEIAALREDLNGLKDAVMKVISRATSDVAMSARDVTSNLAGRVNTTADEIAEKGREAVAATSDRAKNIIDEVEGLARRNPAGALAGAVVLGILIGMMGRRN